nr:hypothetical protein Iba_chr04fCG4700 [Ipomoea batatas]
MDRKGKSIYSERGSGEEPTSKFPPSRSKSTKSSERLKSAPRASKVAKSKSNISPSSDSEVEAPPKLSAFEQDGINSERILLTIICIACLSSCLAICNNTEADGASAMQRFLFAAVGSVDGVEE